MPDWLIAWAKDYGLTGMIVCALVVVIIAGLPHIAKAVTEDRENQRKHQREMLKLQQKLNQRQPKLKLPRQRQRGDK